VFGGVNLPTNIDLSTLNGTNGGFKLSGAAAGDEAGYSVATADVNHDGNSDLIIGAPDANGGAGAVYVVYGTKSGFTSNIDLSSLNGTNGFELSGAPGDHVGLSVAVGDVNGDAFPDLVIGGSGVSYVVYGPLSGVGPQPPNAVNDTATVNEGATVTGNVLTNDSPAGLSATPEMLTGIYGDLTLSSDGSFSYSADNASAINAYGPGHPNDIFTYTATDGQLSASATLDVVINRPPVATNDAAVVAVGATVSGNVLTNDTDPDGDPISLNANVPGTFVGKYGTLVLASDGSYTYTSSTTAQLPTHGVAQDSFTYSENDGLGGTAQANLTVTILAPGTTYLGGAAGSPITAPSNGHSFVLDGSAGNNKLFAANGATTLIGGPGDTLTGGKGADTYAFLDHFGNNTITNYNPSKDFIELDKTEFTNLNAVHDAATQQTPTAPVIISDQAGDTITLMGVNLSQLHFDANHFVLV
jgi:VCBS repeat-containing protein